MKSLMSLWEVLAQECASLCSTSVTMDIKNVRGRVDHEGFSFLTITLPTFGSDLQKGLDQGYVDRNLFQGFSWKGGLPKLFSGFLGLVFDTTSGVLLDNPSVEAIRSVRQLSLLFGKVKLPCSPERVEQAFEGYVQCEHEVRSSYGKLSDLDLFQFRQMGSMLFGRAFTEIDRKVANFECVPKHGPGAVADRLSANEKWELRRWTTRLEKVFPSSEYLIPNHRWYDVLDGTDLVEPGAEVPVRVTTVPKTLKSPRIIGVEPTEMQFAQQSLLPEILEALSGIDYLSDFLGFDDQQPNQLMARQGSLYGDLATLDLSEASDRVSNQLVRLLLHNHPHFSEAVDACRSRKASVPGHGVQRLAKFASMGSALCFPFEAMVFLTIVLLGIQRSLNTSLTMKDLRSLRGKVRIYGDDIIVPVEHVDTVVETLHAFGHVVNSSKSFWTGRFRESCGKDYYAGEDITCVRVRRGFPTKRQHVRELTSLVALRNQMYFSGYWRTTAWLDRKIGKLIHHFPMVLPTSPVLGRHSFLGFSEERMHPTLHTPLVKGYVRVDQAPRDPLSGPGALSKCLTMMHLRERGRVSKLDHLSSGVSSDHLERAGRPKSPRVTLRWSPPY